jgi:Short C-terminal domain/Phospholipase_D-nuclease N-terminal
VLAYDYPLLGVFWSILILFIWIAWFFLLFRIIADIFRSDDLSGWGKALWLIFVILAPFLGVLVYVIARGHSMTQRDLDRARAQEQAFSAYVRETAGASSGGAADELAKLADLKARGVISDAEFEQQKAKVLG